MPEGRRWKYDWDAADAALRSALNGLFAAQRHRNHRKRVNVLNDLVAVAGDVEKARRALLNQTTSKVGR